MRESNYRDRVQGELWIDRVVLHESFLSNFSWKSEQSNSILLRAQAPKRPSAQAPKRPSAKKYIYIYFLKIKWKRN